MIIDINNNIGKRRGKPPVTAEALIRSMDKASVDKAAVFCFPEAMDNDYISDSVKRHRDRLIGLYTVNPWDEDAACRLKDGLDAGFKGLRLEPVRHGYPMNQLDILGPLFEVCKAARVPVWAYGAAEVFSSPILFQELAREFPEVALIIGYMGFNYEASSACSAARRFKNICLDTAGCMSINMERALADVNPEQILMGTGTPDAGYYELEILKVRESAKDLSVQELILGKNAARIFDIDAGDRRGAL